MTTHIPLPSTQIANDKAAPKMRFLYPLAAVCIAAVFLSPSNGEAQTGATKLRPDQERAIELALQGCRAGHAPDGAPAARRELRQFQRSADRDDDRKDEREQRRGSRKARRRSSKSRPCRRRRTSPSCARSTSRSCASTTRRRSQFDKLVNAKVAAYCPASGVYARYGSGWRYEVGQFMMDSALGANNIEARVTIAGEAYMPKDGRYQFDFSKVRTTFDKGAVEAAIKTACDKVHATGKSLPRQGRSADREAGLGRRVQGRGRGQRRARADPRRAAGRL